MSVLGISPQDNRLFNAEIAAKLGDINAAVIIQQLHYWLNKEGVGTIIGKTKYIYNTFNDWIKQFPWLSVWQFRKAMKLLRDLKIVRVIRHKSKQWNQTNYYTLDSDRLMEFIGGKSAESIENSDLRDTTYRDERNQQIEVRDNDISYIDTKKTIQRKTAETENSSRKRSPLTEEKIAAVSLKTNLKKENCSYGQIPYSEKLDASSRQNKPIERDNQTATTGQESSANRSIKEIKNINARWKKQIEELDDLGVQINKTLIGLVKMYSEEEVGGAIALLKCRKQETHIPNMAGYFTAALKEGWSCEAIANTADKNGEAIDKGSIFRLWYELAKELGYCMGQEIREGEQWVSISGSWERWEDATNRGYNLNYLKKVIKRNREK